MYTLWFWKYWGVFSHCFFKYLSSLFALFLSLHIFRYSDIVSQVTKALLFPPSLFCLCSSERIISTGWLPGGSLGEESAYSARDPGSIPGMGRSPGEGTGTPLQYSCLENSMDRGAWWSKVHGVSESDMTDRLIHFHIHWPFLLLISKVLLNLSSTFFVSGTALSDLESLFSYLLQLPFLCCCFPSIHLWSYFPLSFSCFKVLVCYFHLGYHELVSIDWLFYTFTLIWVIFVCFFLCPVTFYCMVDIVDIMFWGLQILLSSFKEYWILFSVLFSHSVVSDSLRPHGLQHARPPCRSPTPGVYSNSCPLSWWCHPTISSSVISFSSHLQSFPASGFFQMSQFFTSGGQSLGVSASASVLPVNIRDWFLLGWIGWISLQSKGLSRVFSNTTVQKHQFGKKYFMQTETKRKQELQYSYQIK